VTRRPVIFVLGPTAVGKSAFALRAAEEFGGIILNCDSVQCYCGVEIGAAKPSPSERIRIPHFLLDWVDPPRALTAAQFRRQAMPVLDEYTKTRPVFAVGGSGFYVQALEKGLYDVKQVSGERKAHWQSRLATEGAEVLHAELRLLDPDYGSRLSPNDHYRILRALMLIEAEGRSMTEIRRRFREQTTSWPFASIKIGFELPRLKLKEKIQARTEAMLEHGLQAEVEKLLALGLKDWAPLKSVGYKEMVQFIEGEIPAVELVPRIVQSTLQLTKKQMTWFRSDPEIRWFSPDATSTWREPMAFLSSLKLT
jgi:tRNA dimethylallyltransferase